MFPPGGDLLQMPGSLPGRGNPEIKPGSLMFGEILRKRDLEKIIFPFPSFPLFSSFFSIMQPLP